MKSTLLILFTFLLIATIKAQGPTLTSADLIKPGDIFSYQYAQAGGIGQVTTGANKTWDYSALVDSNAAEIDSFVTPAATPYPTLFPGANLAFIADTSGFAYYTTSSSGVNAIGEIFGTDTIEFLSPLTVLHYPFSYGSVFGDSIVEVLHTGAINDSLKVIDTLFATGYGTLKIPGATYTNVLQIKTSETVTFLSLPIPATPSVSYAYFTPGNPRALLQVDVDDDGTISDISYLKASVVVPITWISFTAKTFADQTQLNWQTASELNTNYFTVQRSTDGIHFTDLQQVKVSLQQTATRNYSDLDAQPADGKNYYRIKQTNKDGSYTYSTIVQVTFNKKSLITITPSLVHNEDLTLTTNNAKAATAQLYISSADGKLVMSRSLSIAQGPYSQPISISKLARGEYFITVESSEGKQTMRIVKE